LAGDAASADLNCQVKRIMIAPAFGESVASNLLRRWPAVIKNGNQNRLQSMKIDGWGVCAERVATSETDQSQDAVFIFWTIRTHHVICCLMRYSAFKYEHN
jgi:hypothetical protein